MDKLLYTSMGGATRIMVAQQVHANNLANVNTTGFQSDFERVKSYKLKGDGFQTRELAIPTGLGSSFKAGTLQNTGRSLDIAINGEGMFAVQVNGQERYTRRGDFNIDANDRLVLDGNPVLSADGQPVEIPPHRNLTVGNDGTISIEPDSGGSVLMELGTLKRVNPKPEEVAKGQDGFFASTNPGAASLPADDTVTVASGFLEDSNVNPIQELVQTMNLSRQFEMQIKMMKTADTIAQSGNRLIRV